VGALPVRDVDNHFTPESPENFSKVRSTAEYKPIPVEETLRLLATTLHGLSESEGRRRLQLFGRNEVVTKKRSPLIEFLLRFWGPMPWLLELAILLSYLLKHYLEATIIAVLIVINAVIGFLHHSSSQKSLELLKARLAIKARVLRNGSWVTLNAAELVSGDIVVVAMGDIVPADAKIVSGELTIDQSALTGESLLVEVHESDVIYSSSIVRRGEANCVVVNTGQNTYFGKTAELVKIARPKSHQEEIMVAIVRYMMYLGIGALVLVSIDALLTGTDLTSLATFAVIFLMGAVPVALPAVLTITQALGAMELSRKGILVTRLDSIEDAASIDVLCLDKTGTLTMNQLTITDVIPFLGYDKHDVIELAALTAKVESKDTIDLAVKEYAQTISTGVHPYRQISVKPFEPATKRSEAVVEVDNQRFWVIKGAPQIVMALSRNIDEETLKIANETVEALSQKGYRTLAVSKSDGEDMDNLKLVGLLALADPPRPDVKSMLTEAKSLGIKPMMVTGDNIAIAKEIAHRLDIGSRIIKMGDLKGLSEAEQTKMIEECDGLAEVYPEDKYHIVRLLQSRGHMLGMTGDGVNDAPALKQAEIGIAVSVSTDVAKASASVVLTEPGIKVIIEAIKISRQIYQRMLTWVLNKVTKTIQFVGLLTLGFFWLHDVVITLVGMALLVFANDFVTMSLSTDNAKHTANPNRWNVKNISLASVSIGLFFLAEGWLTLLIGKNYFHLAGETLFSFVLLMLIFTSQFRVYIVRERKHFWDSFPSTALLVSTTTAVIISALLGIFGIIIAKLTPYQVLFVLGFSASLTFAIDLPKYYAFRKFGL
jgi:H+-transporting ATPase